MFVTLLVVMMAHVTGKMTSMATHMIMLTTTVMTWIVVRMAAMVAV